MILAPVLRDAMMLHKMRPECGSGIVTRGNGDADDTGREDTKRYHMIKL